MVKPDKRTIEELLKRGVVNVDKPRGPSSHEVAAWVKRGLKIDKAGHSGTLDPKVTGVLPVMLQDATKIIGGLVDVPKEYVCALHLHKEIAEKKIFETFREFTGIIYQRPPVKSAVKRQIRRREIYYIDILEHSEKDVLFKVGCQAGTYIRKLCHDIGEALGVGGHMAELRRTKSGLFDESTVVTLHDLIDAYHFLIEDGEEGPIRNAIKPMEYGVRHLPKIMVRDTAVDAICHGAKLTEPGVVSTTELRKKQLVGIYTLDGEIIALGISVLEGGVVAVAKRVIMEPGTYPRYWKSKVVR